MADRMMHTAVLEVREVHKAFGATAALRGLSFELREGEMLALLGPNGAGKTTLIRALAGRVRLDGGAITLFGKPLLPGVTRDGLGVVPQELALYGLLTARENLELFGQLHGLSGKRLRERTAWALEWTGLVDRAKEPIVAFSGGMKRRLNLACGVLHEPKVVLLDEPTVGVDPQSRERIHEMLGGLRAQGSALLLTTHQLEEAEDRADRIVVVDHGQAIASGTLAEMIQRAGLSGQRVRVDLASTASRAPAGFQLDADGLTLTATVADVAAELPALLAALQQQHLAVRDLEVRGATLQSVFLALTGKDLRE